MDNMTEARRGRTPLLHWARWGVLLAAAAWAPTALAQVTGPVDGTGQPVSSDVLEATPANWQGVIRVATVVALFVVPMILGGFLARWLRMPDHGWKFAVAIGTLAAAAVVLATGEIKLGPDLSGGITLIYELDDSAVSQETAARSEAEGDAGEAKSDDAAAKDAEGEAADEGAKAAEGEETAGDDVEPPAVVAASRSQDETVALLITALQERVDPSGTREVSIRKYGAGQIEIIIPHAEQQELELIEQQIYTAGALEFRIAASPRFARHRSIIDIAERLPANRDVVRVGGRDAARWVAFSEKEFGTLEQAQGRGLVVRMKGKTPQALVMTDDGLDVTGEFLRSAKPDYDEQARPQVSFNFDAQGAFRFGQLTGNHLPDASGQRYNLGILLDNRLLSAPTIESRITDSGRISGGSMTQQEVDFIVRILNAGSLPASLNKTPISRAKISPTLGKLTVEQGKRALIIALAFVALFMFFYYRKAGVISWFGLAANMLLIVGSMVLINAAFTLPGLAGLVLTVGMSVDANVLIYERLRDEFKRGSAMRMAIRNGFDRASQTIIDSNVTNLITGIVIYKIAPDNVKGFGITLVLGILMSVYVAVFLTRIVFDVAERRGWLTTLKMRQFIGETNFDFIKYQKYCLAGSLAVIAVGLAATMMRGRDLLDIDFTGGSSVTLVLDDEHKSSFNDVLAALQETPLKDDNISLVEVGESGTRFTVTTMNDDVDEVEKILAEKFQGRLRTYHMELKSVAAVPGELEQASTPALRVSPWELATSPWALSQVTLLQPAGEGKAAPEDDSAAEEQASDEPPAEAPTDEAAEAEPADAAPAAAAEGEATADGPAANATGAGATEPAAAAEGDEAVTDRFPGGTTATIEFSVDDEGESVGGVSHSALAHLVQAALTATGHKDAAFNLSNPEYQPGSTSERRFPSWTVDLALGETDGRAVLAHLQEQINNEPMFPLSNKIGARVASRMASDAIAAIVFCLLGIIAYVWVRFHGLIYGLAAVAALIHDVLVTLAAVALSYYLVTYFAPGARLLMVDNFQIGLTLVAAFLTIIGYSLNDTIVIFDRIREVKGKSPHLTREMINLAVNQTFARTLLTAFTSLISVAVLYFIGGAGIHAFAFALLVGFVAGCYSTIYIANPVLYWLSQRAEAAAKSAKSRAA